MHFIALSVFLIIMIHADSAYVKRAKLTEKVGGRHCCISKAPVIEKIGELDGIPSLIIPISGRSNRFIITLTRIIAILTWDGISSTPKNVETVAIVDDGAGLENNRINDGKADVFGNLWAGSMAIDGAYPTGPRTGRLFSMNSNNEIRYQRTNVGVSNGIAWSKDLKKMYYIDSSTRVIDQYDFDAFKGLIKNRQTLFSLEKHNIPGYPDGQTIDADDNLWVAVFAGSRVIKISTNQTEMLLYTIFIPDQQITSVAFGGSDLDELYVTSAGEQWYDFQGEGPILGHVYKITGLCVRGVLPNRINI